jgi:phenylacetate-CoA ligase
MGRKFRQVRRVLNASEDFGPEQLRAYQVRQLRQVLDVAFTRVSFYVEWARREGANAEDFREPEDVRRLPLVSKDMIRDNRRAFTDPSRSRLTYSTDSTGGTSGRPFEFLTDNQSYRMEQAFISHLWERAGYWLMAPKATLRGRPVINPKTGNKWAYNPIHNELNLSIYQMTKPNLPDYVGACARFGVRFLHGYPSAVSVLADFLVNHEDHKNRFPPLKAVFGASEGLRPGQRELIEEAFGCRLFTWYGMSERVILAGECEGSHFYHCFPQYGITEIIDAEGRSITEPGVEGELVGTGFLNRVMPFIRYQTGDYSSWVAGPCPGCHRRHPLLNKVHGRWLQEQMVGKNGQLISVTALNMHGRVFANIERYQFYQDTPGKGELRLLPGEGFKQNDLGRIARALDEKIKGVLELEIKLVDSLPLTPGGKGIYLVQKLSIDDARPCNERPVLVRQ